MTAVVRLALARPYTFVVMAILVADFRRAVGDPDADRYFSEYRHPGHLRRLELYRPAAGRHGGPHRRALRTRAFDDGQRHRAYRVAVASGLGVVKIYFQPNVEHQRRAGAGHIDIANHPEAASARRHPADHPGLQRLERSDHPAGAVERHAFPDRALRSRPEFHPAAARRRSRAPSFHTPMAAPPARCRSISTRTRCTPTTFRRPTSATRSPGRT